LLQHYDNDSTAKPKQRNEYVYDSEETSRDERFLAVLRNADLRPVPEEFVYEGH
jgi:hypothetical protein